MSSKLADFSLNTKDTSLCCTSLNCLSQCLKQIECDTFLQENFINLLKIWRKNPIPEVAKSMWLVISQLKGGIKTLFFRGVTLATEISSNNHCESYIQKQLCDWMINTINEYKKYYKLDSAVDVESTGINPSSPSNQNPIGFDDFTPVKTSQSIKHEPINLDQLFESDTSKQSSVKQEPLKIPSKPLTPPPQQFLNVINEPTIQPQVKQDRLKQPPKLPCTLR